MEVSSRLLRSDPKKDRRVNQVTAKENPGTITKKAAAQFQGIAEPAALTFASGRNTGTRYDNVYT